MVEEPKALNRYLMVELSCDETQCMPCTYPNCQRFVRENPKKKIKNPALSVRTVSMKASDAKAPTLRGDERSKPAR